jgi:hypothetical protein
MAFTVVLHTARGRESERLIVPVDQLAARLPLFELVCNTCGAGLRLKLLPPWPGSHPDANWALAES